MRGFVFTSLKQFVTDGYGADTWTKLLDQAGLAKRSYLAGTTYPDAEAVKLVTTASAMTGLPAADLLRAFGKALAPGLFKMYGPFIKPQWGALDLIAEVETHVHKAVRLGDKEATPPQLKAVRTGPRQVIVEYGSARKLCALAEGIVQGVAAHYREPLAIDHTTCMLRGDAHCTLVVNAL